MSYDLVSSLSRYIPLMTILSQHATWCIRWK